MNEKVLFGFYRVQQCGFYAFGVPDVQFGNFTNTLGELAQWSSHQIIGNTKLLEASGNDHVLAVYLAGVEQAAGLSLITLWNEVPAGSENKLASIPANQRVGQAKMVMNDIVKGTIPGYPTYFLAIPSKGVIATLRFDSPLLGQVDLRNYIEQFLATSSSHAVQLPPDPNDPATIEVYAYRKDARSKPREDVMARFRTVSMTKPGQVAFLLKHSAHVRRVHRRINLDFAAHEKPALWQEALEMFGLSSDITARNRTTVKFDMGAELDQAAMKSLISDWKARGESRQDDYGFTLRGDSNIHWLSSTRAKGELHLDVVRDERTQQIDTKALLEVIAGHKNDVLKMLV